MPPYLDNYERDLFSGITTLTREDYDASYLAHLREMEEAARRYREEAHCLRELELAREKDYIDSLSPNTEFARWIKRMFPTKKI
jgi:hypothetical protein